MIYVLQERMDQEGTSGDGVFFHSRQMTSIYGQIYGLMDSFSFEFCGGTGYVQCTPSRTFSLCVAKPNIFEIAGTLSTVFGCPFGFGIFFLRNTVVKAT